MARIPNVNSGTHVVFRIHAVPNEVKSKEQGRPVYDDLEVCDIKMAGNTLSWGTFPAHDFADWEGDDGFGGKSQRTYAQKYNAEYLAFKDGNAQAMGGTPIEELPFLTNGKRLELKGLNIYTAEALASLDGNNLKRLGMGGRELKDQAQAYIDMALDGANTSALRAELESRDAMLADMRKELDALKAANGPQTGSVGTAKGNDPLDHDSNGKKGGSLPKEKEAPEQDDKWSTFEDDDIKAWLVQANVEVDGRWKRARLIEEAEQVLAKDGKKNATT